MSSPLWWGDWRPTLTPHTGNLLATDLIECTMIVAGNPVNTVITGAQILGAVPTPSVAWGSITGTLSSQTDLSTALSGKASTGAVTGTGITMSTATILGRSTAGTGAIEEITIGSGLTLSAGTLTASGGGGGGLTVGTTAIASGTIGRVLFQGTGNVLQQSANLFWDNTNSRLGIGTSSPNMSLDIRTGNVGIGVTLDAGFKLDVNGTARVRGQISLTNGSALIYPPTASTAQEGLAIYRGASTSIKALTIGITNSDEVVFNTTNADYIFNRTGTEVFNIGGGGTSIIRTRYFGSFQQAIPTGTNINFCFGTSNTSGGQRLQFGFDSNEDSVIGLRNSSLRIRQTVSNHDFININATTGNVVIEKNTSVLTPIASAKLAINSTTEGFLPPRMTNAQMLAIATPAAGLVVYDTTNNKHCGYNGTAWQNFY